jgi:hypothetical protein
MVRFLHRICSYGGRFYGKVPAQNLLMVAGSMVRFLHRICSYGGRFYGKVTAKNLFLWSQLLWQSYGTECALMVQGYVVSLLLRICSYGNCFGLLTSVFALV